MTVIKERYFDKEGNIIKEVPYEAGEYDYIASVNKYETDLQECMSNRRCEYNRLWPTPWDWNDDVMVRGLEAVEKDKLAIKAKYPKPPPPSR